MKNYNATIMIVDDDPNDLFLIERALLKIGATARIRPVNGGSEAIAYMMGEGEGAGGGGCGDGTVQASEECDEGVVTDTPTCDSDCTLPVCGDAHLNTAHGEVCDEGAQTATCDGDCTLPVCGDGRVNGPAGELCDDGNTDACGTCGATCTTANAPAKASGTITAIASNNFADGETFTLDDGIGPPVVFEFDNAGGVGGQHVAVNIGGVVNAATMATRIATAINANPIQITAVASAGNVALTADQFGAFGNRAILEAVANNGFNVVGMNGGRARD